MVPRLYLVRTALCAIYADGEKGILTIPSGATVEVTDHPDGERFLCVHWSGTHLLVFTEDFEERTAPFETN